MRLFYFISFVAFVAAFSSCSDNGASAKTICDTTCKSDSIRFEGDHPLHPRLAIGLNKCRPDTMVWKHDEISGRTWFLPEFIGAVRINESAMSHYFKDTSYIWLQFNDCVSQRGYALKLNYDGTRKDRVIGAAFTKFDPKFSIEDGLVAYTDKGSVFVENMETGQKAISPFDKAYDINFNKIHETVDSVNITKNRVYVEMIRNGEKKPYEKKINL